MVGVILGAVIVRKNVIILLGIIFSNFVGLALRVWLEWGEVSITEGLTPKRVFLTYVPVIMVTYIGYIYAERNIKAFKGDKMKNIRKSKLIILLGGIWIFFYFAVILYGNSNLMGFAATFNLILFYVIVIILVFKFLINNFGTKQIEQQNKEILEKMNEMQQKIDEMQEKINEK